jgi:hypothetical protein
MRKRSNNKCESFDFLHFNNYLLVGQSPNKTPILKKETVYDSSKKDKFILELPKIYPMHSIIKAKMNV